MYAGIEPVELETRVTPADLRFWVCGKPGRSARWRLWPRTGVPAASAGLADGGCGYCTVCARQDHAAAGSPVDAEHRTGHLRSALRRIASGCGACFSSPKGQTCVNLVQAGDFDVDVVSGGAT